MLSHVQNVISEGKNFKIRADVINMNLFFNDMKYLSL